MRRNAMRECAIRATLNSSSPPIKRMSYENIDAKVSARKASILVAPEI